MKQLYTFAFCLALLFVSTSVSAQYFENFDSNPSGASGNIATGWTASPTGTNGFTWRTQAGPTTSGGTSPNADHTTGTATGIYVYTEGSTPAAPGDTARLTSPNIDLSSVTNPGISFYYHKAGVTMGDLFIDIYNVSTNTWYFRYDSIMGSVQTAVSDPFLERVVNLTQFSNDTIQIRFTAGYLVGNVNNWSTDMAIDDVSLVSIPATNGAISSSSYNPNNYQTPLDHSPQYSFTATAANAGSQPMTNVKIHAMVGNYEDSINVGTLAPTAISNGTIATAFTPSTAGFYKVKYWVSSDQVDTLNSNDTTYSYFNVTDDTYAPADSTIANGIGYNAATGYLGQLFTFPVTDTITSVDFFLNAPTAGEICQVEVFSFDTATSASTPYAIMDDITIGNAGYYSSETDCGGIIVSPGNYLIAVQQKGQTNLSLGYTANNYTPFRAFIRQDTNGWQALDTLGFQVNYTIFARTTREVEDLELVGTLMDPYYSMIPDDQPLAVGFAARVKNLSGIPMSSVTVSADLNGTVNQVTIPSIGICTDTIVTINGFNTGTTIGQQSATTYISAAVDINPTNDTATTSFIVTDSIFARDDSATAQNLRLQDIPGAGFNTRVGQVFEYFAGDTIEYLSAYVNNAFSFDTLRLFIYDLQNGLPNNQLFQSESILFNNGTTSGWFRGRIQDCAPVINSGTYAIVAELQIPTSEIGIAPVLTAPADAFTNVGASWVSNESNDLKNYFRLRPIKGNTTPLPIMNLPADTCFNRGDTLFIVPIEGNNPNYGYHWSTGATLPFIEVGTEGTYILTVTNSAGCTTTDAIIIDTCLIIDTTDTGSGVFVVTHNEMQLSIYPNPAKDKLNIINNQYHKAGIHLIILDLNGRIKHEMILSEQQTSIEIADWTPGVYLMRLTSEQNQQTIKLIKR